MPKKIGMPTMTGKSLISWPNKPNLKRKVFQMRKKYQKSRTRYKTTCTPDTMNTSFLSRFVLCPLYDWLLATWPESMSLNMTRLLMYKSAAMMIRNHHSLFESVLADTS